MTIDNLITRVNKDLTSLIEREYKENQYKFHSNEFLLLGVRTNNVRNLIHKIYKEIKLWNEKDVYLLVESLLKMKYNEYIILAFGLAHKWTKELRENHFDIFESWIINYVVDWGQCDDLSCGILGKLIYQNPKLINRLKVWTKSDNLWLRRSSAVSMIISLRSGRYLEESFQIAENLLMDTNDMVQKGYGWMLKEASKNFQREVFEFVVKRKTTMPRVALRYAIEKMPLDLKAKAMAR